MIMIKGNKVFVNWVQFGPSYSNHNTAVSEGKKVQQKHYPTYRFVDAG